MKKMFFNFLDIPDPNIKTSPVFTCVLACLFASVMFDTVPFVIRLRVDPGRCELLGTFSWHHHEARQTAVSKEAESMCW